MIGLYYFSVISFVAYIIYNLVKHGISTSISDTYYLNGGKLGKKLFWAWAICSALPMMIYWLDISTDTPQYLVFLSTAALMFVGTAGAFKENMTREVHNIAAIIAAFLSHLWIISQFKYWTLLFLVPLVIALIIGYFVKVKDSSGNKVNTIVYFGELACFLNIYVSIVLYK